MFYFQLILLHLGYKIVFVKQYKNRQSCPDVEFIDTSTAQMQDICHLTLIVWYDINS
jgi:hypothetical protein